jgi:hypothetical protein
MNKCIKTFKPVLVLFLCTSLLILPVFDCSSILMAQDIDIEKTLADAEQKYTEGRFDETIALLTVCIESPDVTPEQKQKAYRLMGLTYIAKDYLTEAKNSIEKLLKLVPNYQPDPIFDPPPFINLVKEVQEETVAKQVTTKEEAESSNIWWYVGGGAAVVLVGAVLLSGGSDDDTTQPQNLPAPPSLP